MPASSIVCHLPLKLTCGSAQSARMTSTCSSDRRPRLWKFSLRPTNSISFHPTPMPSRNRPPDRTRSEEHTSELQSQFHLVCRLLLEKKKRSRDQAACTGKEKQLR